MMKNCNRWGAALFTLLVFLLSLCAPALATEGKALDDAIQNTAEYVCKAARNPQVGAVGGEWAVLGLARSGNEVPEGYFQSYYAAVERYVEDCGGVLHDKKYTEYSRVIISLAALGKDARDVVGYDLTRPLGDYDKTVWQGLNGPIWALLALDSRDYPMPQNPEVKTQATRQMYIDCILEYQLPDGGWRLDRGSAGDQSADPDLTGMALQALAKYQDQMKVSNAIQKALSRMSKQQDEDGGYSGSLESCVQMMVALSELGISLNDTRFVKNENTLLDGLLAFSALGGGFLHAIGDNQPNQMASEQALYGMVAAQRLRDGKRSLYRMTGVEAIPEVNGDVKEEGLPGKDPAVKRQSVIQAGKTFDDVAIHESRAAVEALAARGIISGGSDGLFHPDDNMKRSEFASIIVKGLGLKAKVSHHFSDVPPDAWYAGVVGAASSCGIVSGDGTGSFQPENTISRQEAAVMVCNAAKLCGMDAALDSSAARNILSQFPDYVTAPQWARSSLAFCYREGILSKDDNNIRPLEPITRAEVAQMLYYLLGAANLL